MERDIVSNWAAMRQKSCHDNNNTADFNECRQESTNACEQVCVNTPGSYSCACNVGYRLNADGRTCQGTTTCSINTERKRHLFVNYIDLFCPFRTSETSNKCMSK